VLGQHLRIPFRSTLTSRVDPSISVNNKVTARLRSPFTTRPPSRSPAAADSTATRRRPPTGPQPPPPPHRAARTADLARGGRRALPAGSHMEPRSDPPRSKHSQPRPDRRQRPTSPARQFRPPVQACCESRLRPPAADRTGQSCPPLPPQVLPV
jgi:hypothetical protein